MVSVNKASYNNRKVHAVTTATYSFIGLNANTSGNILASTIAYDPLETIDTTASAFKFTAPYSRFYKVRLFFTFTSESGTYDITSQSDRLAGADTILTTTVTLKKNSVAITNPAADGGIYTGGAVDGVWQSGPTSLVVDEVSFSAATGDFVIFLESGDTLEATYGITYRGYRSLSVDKIVGAPFFPVDPDAYGTITAGAGSSVSGLINVQSYSLSTTYSELTSFVLTNGASPVAFSGDAGSYIEIVELDRE